MRMVLQETRPGSALAHKLEARTARVGVLGLGYAGLPMAVAMGEAGYRVVGLDLDSNRAATVRAGRSPVSHVPDSVVSTLARSGRLDASDNMSELESCDVAVICVPTPFGTGKAPDLRYVRMAGDSIAECLHPEMLVILQSTVPPGTTQNVLGSTLDERGLQVGSDYFLAFCPERIDPGSINWTIHNTPKLIGGSTPRCTQLAASFFSPVCDTVVPCSSPEVAEFAKLVENTYRFVNISLANEMAVLCDRVGVSVWEVIDAASTKPFAFQKHTPGPGVGGDCIPVVPFQLQTLAQEHGLVAEFVEAARRVNESQPSFVVGKLERLLAPRHIPLNQARVLCLGVTYKSDVADLRESAALRVLEELQRGRADVRYWDRFFPEVTVGCETIRRSDLDDALLAWADATVLLVPHSGPDYDHVARGSRLVLDTVNYLSRLNLPNVVPL
jgi:UDP-N-acetyl-D-glucosamine dehydrogenase